MSLKTLLTIFESNLRVFIATKVNVRLSTNKMNMLKFKVVEVSLQWYHKDRGKKSHQNNFEWANELGWN